MNDFFKFEYEGDLFYAFKKGDGTYAVVWDGCTTPMVYSKAAVEEVCKTDWNVIEEDANSDWLDLPVGVSVTLYKDQAGIVTFHIESDVTNPITGPVSNLNKVLDTFKAYFKLVRVTRNDFESSLKVANAQ